MPHPMLAAEEWSRERQQVELEVLNRAVELSRASNRRPIPPYSSAHEGHLLLTRVRHRTNTPGETSKGRSHTRLTTDSASRSSVSSFAGIGPPQRQRHD